jgi:hypothetical protein
VVNLSNDEQKLLKALNAKNECQIRSGDMLRPIGVVLIVLGLAGCSVSTKFIAMDQTTRSKIKSVAVVEVTEPAFARVANIGGSASFIPLAGPLVQNSINRDNGVIYSDKIHKEKVEFAPDLHTSMIESLKNANLRVADVSGQKAKIVSNGQSTRVDIAGIKTDADVVLHLGVSVAYISSATSVNFIPFVFVNAIVNDVSMQKEIYNQGFMCGWEAPIQNAIFVPALEKYKFATFGSLLDRFPDSVEGLKQCERDIASKIAKEITRRD